MLGKIATGIAVAGLLSASSAYGEGVSVGVKAGTLGAGVELEAQMTQTLSGRLGLNYFSYSYDGTEDDIKYDFDATLQTVGALLDWHPFSNGFRISAGVMINGNELEGVHKRQTEPMTLVIEPIQAVMSGRSQETLSLMLLHHISALAQAHPLVKTVLSDLSVILV